jgi:hypothetical protein
LFVAGNQTFKELRAAMTKTSSSAKAAVALILCGMLLWTGCSTTWIGQAEQIVAALIPAAANIVALVAALEGKSISAADMQVIRNAGSQAGADLQLIESLIAAYQKADEAGKPAILNQIQNAISAVQANLEGLLPALHIKDAATQTKITAVVGILLSEVESLAAIVPLVNPNASPKMMATATAQAKKRPPLSAREFVSSYNATLTAKTGNAELDRATTGLQIHVHGRVTRIASAGVLK